MARSRHTEPRALRSARRMDQPFAGRGDADASARRREGRQAKEAGVPAAPAPRPAAAAPRLRVIVRRPRKGFHHPAGKREVTALLAAVGALALYGLRSVELGRAEDAATAPASPRFGRYHVPGRIVLVEQPVAPWHLPGALSRGAAARLRRWGAVLTTAPGAAATQVDWPPGALRRFMLEEVLLHELGHHVLQHHKGKRQARIARTRDHEAFAQRFARRQRAALRRRAARDAVGPGAADRRVPLS